MLTFQTISLLNLKKNIRQNKILKEENLSNIIIFKKN
jgi:hypothetical protein